MVNSSPAPQSEVQAPRTFQGRQVILTKFRDRMVEAVAGARAVKFASSAVFGERGFAAFGGPNDRPALGIAVVSDRAMENFERGASLGIAAPIEWEEPLLIDRGAALPNDEMVSQQWALQAIAADPAWTATVNPERVIIAVLDSGVPIESGSLSHADLSEAARLHLGRDLVNNDGDPADDHGHGTHVLGIVGATHNNGIGIAGLWTGSVMVLKVFNSLLDGSSVTFKDGVVAAIDFAEARNAKLVINYSGGGPDSRVKQEAVNHARDQGALLVASAGNAFGLPIMFPAAYAATHENVIAVGAVDEQLASPRFASRGPEMSVVAPGAGVLSTMPNYLVTLNNQGKQTKYDQLDGTSQAAPHVSALAALIWAKNPQLTAGQVRDVIRSTADPIGSDADLFGSGIINVTRALSAP